MHAVKPVWCGEICGDWRAGFSKCLLLGNGAVGCCEMVFTGVHFVRFGADLSAVRIVMGDGLVFVYYPLGHQWLYAGYAFRVCNGRYEGYFVPVYDYNLDSVKVIGNAIHLSNREIAVLEGYLLDSSCRRRILVDIDFVRHDNNIVSFRGDVTPYTVIHKDNVELVVKDGIYEFTLCGSAECFELELRGRSEE